ncbi:tyrosine-type recombinase/integrase [Arthrobacter sp. SO3]|uniref:tyrosine-type recombinase/integrase n=1 Tax=Arthrobacter sp. SO3 TaxID=1897057 RepID=UPI001D001211|nr:site-specific integrase [Arthrobacter sp. SO3]MCB5292843.1 Tyrosine recombinase XerD [Arthrobacter sp. SO3]
MDIHEDHWTVEALLAAFDEHLQGSRGLCLGTRRNYAGHVEQFLKQISPAGVVDTADIRAVDVVDFIGSSAKRYGGSRTVGHVATSLRSFFRFLRATGLRTDRLEDSVPTVQHRPSDLPRHLDSTQLARLVASLDSWSTPRGLRDGAIVLCMARLGLRSSEVVQLRLEDIDWRNGTLRVSKRKTGHGALLPLTEEVGAATASYLQHGRPKTTSRRVFVLDRLRTGAPISESIVGRAVERAVRRADIDAPMRGANLLRHSLATGLLAGGATLGQIADLMGHRSLTTTGIYARVDIAALAEVGLAWPETAS